MHANFKQRIACNLRNANEVEIGLKSAFNHLNLFSDYFSYICVLLDPTDIQEWRRILIASADSDEIDEESLHIFFESEKIGGGEIESIESLGDSYKMMFADIEGMILS